MTRSTTTAPAAAVDPNAERVAELLKVHAELVATYPATQGAAKAQVSRKLNLAQAELDLLDAEFTYWERPSAVVVRSYTHDPAELIDRLTRLEKLAARKDRPEVSKSTALREIKNIKDQMPHAASTFPAPRRPSIPPPRWTRSAPKSRRVSRRSREPRSRSVRRAVDDAGPGSHPDRRPPRSRRAAVAG